MPNKKYLIYLITKLVREDPQYFDVMNAKSKLLDVETELNDKLEKNIYLRGNVTSDIVDLSDNNLRIVNIETISNIFENNDYSNVVEGTRFDIWKDPPKTKPEEAKEVGM